MGVAQPLRQNHADLRKPLIVRLKAREHEVEAVLSHRLSERAARHERICTRQPIVLHVNGAVGAAGERLADDLRDPRRSGRTHDHLTAVLLFQTQRLFERVRVGLVHLEAGVLLANPRFVVVQPGLPFACGDLLDADGDLHLVIWSFGNLVIYLNILTSMRQSNDQITR